jgi:serine/threonine-protein kinase
MAAHPRTPKESPLQIGPYRVLKRIGAGGMGAVYKAVHVDLDRQVALKVLPPDLASNPDMIARFRLEAQHAAKMRHENIVTLYEFGESKGTHYLAMEFVEGQNLYQYIERKGKLDPEEARKFTMQAVQALALANQHNIVHRDIKPANFLLTNKDGRAIVKLTDFGLARSLTEDDFKVTRTGTTVGTVDYISPEQARNSRAADIRSDIYSLGCTLYHMLAGRPPFQHGDLAERLMKHIEVQPPDVRQFNPKVSLDLAAIVERMLAKKPADRYQTPRELFQDLERLATGPALNAREAIELLAAGEKPLRPTPSEPRKQVAAASTRALTPPSPAIPVTKLHYRHLRKRQRAKDDEGPPRPPLVIAGWMAWVAVLGGAALLTVIGILVAQGLSKAARAVPKTTAAERGEADNLVPRQTVDRTQPQSEQPDRPGAGDANDPAMQPAAPVQTWPGRTEEIYHPSPKELEQLSREFEKAKDISHANPPEPSPSPRAPEPSNPPQANREQTPSRMAAQENNAPEPASRARIEVSPRETINRAPVQSVASARTLTPAVYVVGRFRPSNQGKGFAFLAEACAASHKEPESILEIHENGPLYLSGLTIAGRTLVLRAGKGYRPLVAWDLQNQATAEAKHLFAATGGKLVLENLDLVVNCAEMHPAEGASLISLTGAELQADGCTFSVAGRQHSSFALIRVEGERSAVRLRHCYLRSTDATTFDLRGQGAEVLLDRCLVVGGSQPLIDLRAKQQSPAVRLRLARSTLVVAQTLMHVRLVGALTTQPAVDWLGWDLLVARSGLDSGGSLLDLDQGVGTEQMAWRAVNCLYCGWLNLLQSAAQVICQSDLPAWREHWHQKEGDRALANPWPADLPGDLSEAPSALFRVAGTHADVGASSIPGSIGCNVAELPTVPSKWRGRIRLVWIISALTAWCFFCGKTRRADQGPTWNSSAWSTPCAGSKKAVSCVSRCLVSTPMAWR